MKAAVYYGPNKVEIADVAEPDTEPGTVKLKVGFNGICGTDLHEYYAGPIFVPTEPHPLTASAAAADIGPRVLRRHHRGRRRGRPAGPRATGSPSNRSTNAGTARRAGPATTTSCQQIGFHGLMSDGGMAEYTVVPDRACCTGCPTTCRWNSARWSSRCRWPTTPPPSATSTPGDTAMVFGAGPIGIGLWFALRGKGVDDVFVVEPSPTRRAAIEALGATTLDPTRRRRARVHRRPHRGRRRRRGVRRRGRGARRSRRRWPASAPAGRWSASRSTRSRWQLRCSTW